MAADSKSKLLLSAFEEFAKNGFWGASTRDIAAKANINISSILYYFGGKKGMYTAMLKKIAEVVNNMTADLNERSEEVLSSKNPTAARTLLKEVMKRFLDILCLQEISADLKKVFLSEYSNPTEEFQILYDELIQPIHENLADLLSLASNQKINDKECRFYIVSLFSQLFVLASRKERICNIMEWPDYNTEATSWLSDYINSQIDFILDHK